LLANVVNAINATLFEKLSYDFLRDIAPVASIARVPNVMEVHPSLPVTTVPEFIAYAKANPGKINMGSAGKGTIGHVSCEPFKMMTGVNMVHVPYRGSAPMLTDLLGGQAARLGGNDCDALGGGARHPDRGRSSAGLRGERLVWHWHSEQDTRLYR
jgi:tripartite-type tricarboxylate transporter receptor subunit TctC